MKCKIRRGRKMNQKSKQKREGEEDARKIIKKKIDNQETEISKGTSHKGKEDELEKERIEKMKKIKEDLRRSVFMTYTQIYK